MANNRSAKKRIQISERNRKQNQYYKSTAKTFRKKLFNAVDQHKANPDEMPIEEVRNIGNQAFSKIDKAVKVKAIPKNTAARQKSQISKAIASISSFFAQESKQLESVFVTALPGDPSTGFPIASNLDGDPNTPLPPREDRERRRKKQKPTEEIPDPLTE